MARVKLLADGSARVEIAAHDVGTGADTTMAQIAANALSIKPEQVSVAMGATLLPTGPVSGGSVTTAGAGSAVKLACQQILGRLELPAGATPAQRRRDGRRKCS